MTEHKASRGWAGAVLKLMGAGTTDPPSRAGASLQNDFGVPKKSIAASAYWMVGRSMDD
jgi:hypothetical protein